MTTGHFSTGLQDMGAVLSSPILVRLVTEIDDNGTIEQRGLASALPDLTPHHIRQATEQADALELLDRTGDGIGLTTAGLHLADLYDAAARWARQHDFPDQNCDFPSRIRDTFALLTDHATNAYATGSAAHDGGLDHLHDQLAEWIRTHQPQNLGDTWGTAA